MVFMYMCAAKRSELNRIGQGPGFIAEELGRGFFHSR